MPYEILSQPFYSSLRNPARAGTEFKVEFSVLRCPVAPTGAHFISATSHHKLASHSPNPAPGKLPQSALAMPHPTSFAAFSRFPLSRCLGLQEGVLDTKHRDPLRRAPTQCASIFRSTWSQLATSRPCSSSKWLLEWLSRATCLDS